VTTSDVLHLIAASLRIQSRLWVSLHETEGLIELGDPQNGGTFHVVLVRELKGLDRPSARYPDPTIR
jgi:hypothetical protein